MKHVSFQISVSGPSYVMRERHRRPDQGKLQSCTGSLPPSCVSRNRRICRPAANFDKIRGPKAYMAAQQGHHRCWVVIFPWSPSTVQPAAPSSSNKLTSSLQSKDQQTGRPLGWRRHAGDDTWIDTVVVLDLRVCYQRIRRMRRSPMNPTRSQTKVGKDGSWVGCPLS